MVFSSMSVELKQIVSCRVESDRFKQICLLLNEILLSRDLTTIAKSCVQINECQFLYPAHVNNWLLESADKSQLESFVSDINKSMSALSQKSNLLNVHMPRSNKNGMSVTAHSISALVKTAVLFHKYSAVTEYAFNIMRCVHVLATIGAEGGRKRQKESVESPGLAPEQYHASNLISEIWTRVFDKQCNILLLTFDWSVLWSGTDPLMCKNSHLFVRNMWEFFSRQWDDESLEKVIPQIELIIVCDLLLLSTDICFAQGAPTFEGMCNGLLAHSRCSSIDDLKIALKNIETVVTFVPERKTKKSRVEVKEDVDTKGFFKQKILLLVSLIKRAIDPKYSFTSRDVKFYYNTFSEIDSVFCYALEVVSKTMVKKWQYDKVLAFAKYCLWTEWEAAASLSLSRIKHSLFSFHQLAQEWRCSVKSEGAELYNDFAEKAVFWIRLDQTLVHSSSASSGSASSSSPSSSSSSCSFA